jgi:hypothetical protein
MELMIAILNMVLGSRHFTYGYTKSDWLGSQGIVYCHRSDKLESLAIWSYLSYYGTKSLSGSLSCCVVLLYSVAFVLLRESSYRLAIGPVSL